MILPGVALLFAFLITIPFSSRFPELRDLERAAYFVAFVSTAVALVCLVGETAYRRLRGKPYDKRVLVRTASREAIAGIACLGVALVAVVFLVSDLLFSGGVAVTVTLVVLALALMLWFILPLVHRVGGPWPRGRDREARRDKDDATKSASEASGQATEPSPR